MLERARLRLEKELHALEHEFRHELPKEIHRALQMGDLRENAEYQSALERQHFVKSRITQLQEQLKNLAMIDLNALPRDRAGLGSTVTVLDVESGKTLIYELTIPEESDFGKGLVSITSPIGKALVGCKKGDDLTIKIPAGQRVYEVKKVVTLHDKGPQ